MSAMLLMVLLAAAPDGGVDVLAPMRGFVKASSHGSVTQCGACHVTSAWTDVRFNHERTGFPLTGRHARTSCKACHVQDFSAPVPRTCGGCHRDVHAGELGQRCEGCHDTADWRSRFDVDAHRRTNFPLLGAHAALPCVECHAEARERRFSRSTTDCQTCHAVDAQRASMLGFRVDHEALGFVARPCRECHNPVSYRPARFPDHDRCFPINAGAHAGVSCARCHDKGQPLVSSPGTCNTGTFGCKQCHTNDGAEEIGNTDAQHREVPGYRWVDQLCLDCHYPRGGRP